MNKKLLTFLVVLLLHLGSELTLKAQQIEPSYGQGIRVNLDTSGKKYLRIITWHQVWARYAENNPGSTVNGELTNSQFDMAMRRSRMLFLVQLSPRFLILSHFGINNQTLVSGGGNGQGASGTDGKKPQLFLHDAWAEYKGYKHYLDIGAGLHYWNGPTRMTNASTLTFMTIDAPIHNWYNIEATDQFARYFGIYAKGKLLNNKRLDYRVAVNTPFAMQRTNALTALDTVQAFNGKESSAYRGLGPQKLMTTGYFQYQFWDIESNVLPFTQGTYIGTKKVFNIGAGWAHTPDMMWTAQKNATTGRVDTQRVAQTMLAADVFLDLPLNKEKGTALTLYGTAQFYDMGKNYIRNIGISNPSNGVGPGSTWTGAGDATPTIGTGTILYAQAGYVLPSTKIGKFQPYAAVSHANYDRISDAVVIPDLGLNYFVSGHNAKITFNYRQRPYFDRTTPAQRQSDIVKKGTKNEFTVQFQVFL
jgi:hypothetical protein